MPHRTRSINDRLSAFQARLRNMSHRRVALDAIDRMIVHESVGGDSGFSRRPVVEYDSASDLDDGFDDEFANESGDEQDEEDDDEEEEEEERGDDTDEEGETHERFASQIQRDPALLGCGLPVVAQISSRDPVATQQVGVGVWAQEPRHGDERSRGVGALVQRGLQVHDPDHVAPFWRRKEWFMVLCIQYAVIVRTNDIGSWEMLEDVPETFFSLHAKVKETMEERGYLPTPFSDIFDAIEAQVVTWRKSPRAAVVMRDEDMRGDEWKTPLRLYGVKTDDLSNLVRALDNMVVHGNVVNIPAESIAHCYKTARPQGRQTNEVPSDLDVITSFRDDILLSEIRYVTRLKLEKGCYDEHRDERVFPDMTEFAPAEAVLEDELEDEAGTVVPVKRKPGRPRMSDAQKRAREEVAETSGESPAKKKRGRPVTKNVAAVAAAKGEKRGRGRPRKYLEVVRVPVTAPTPEDDGDSVTVHDDEDIGISRNGGGPAGTTGDGADANGGGAEANTSKAGHDVEASVPKEAGNTGKPNSMSLSFMME
ncbi:hypothetical protein PG997_000629 [Apiospora hydei]|uniref:Uncharacterized protein n=1 Tax=Apiospora hydei TaxID=1337664 RepID=A0ABR1XBE1_9PEZI